MAEVFKEKTVKIHEATDKPIFDVMQEIAGISTDTKPTNVATGSVFFETDTTKIYIYDGVNEQWNEVTCGGGGGGGGNFEEIHVTIRSGVVTEQMEFVELKNDSFRIGGCDWETAKYEIDFETVNGMATISVIGKNGKAYIAKTIDTDNVFVTSEILNQVSGVPVDFIVSGATFGDSDIEITDGANLVIFSLSIL